MNSIKWSTKECLFKLFPLIITISFGMDVFVPSIPVMSDYLHISPNYMQASLYLFMISVAFGQLAVGPLADRFGRRTLAIACALLFLVGSFFASLAMSAAILFFARIIQAVGACGTYLLCFIVIRDNFSTQQCGRLFSLLTGINAIAASTAPIVGGLLLDLTGSWRSGFYFLTILGIIITITVFKNVPDYTYNKSDSDETLMMQWLQIIRNRYFRKYTLIAVNGMLGLYLFCALSPEILIRDLHLSGTLYGLWFGANAVTAFIANFIAARMSLHKKLEYIIILGLVIMLIASICMFVFNWQVITVLKFMLPMLLLTLGIGISMGCATALALKDFEHKAGTATALVSAAQFFFAGFVGMLITYWPLSPMGIAIPMLIFSILNILSRKA